MTLIAYRTAFLIGGDAISNTSTDPKATINGSFVIVYEELVASQGGHIDEQFIKSLKLVPMYFKARGMSYYIPHIKRAFSCKLPLYKLTLTKPTHFCIFHLRTPTDPKTPDTSITFTSLYSN